jgi:hypothetical protein
MIAAYVLEGARDGRSVADLMEAGRHVLTADDVMEAVTGLLARLGPEAADFLRRAGVLASDRIRAVRTGCCPHTAIRDDIAANLEAAEDLERAHAPLDLLIIESGGDNLTATFSRGLVDAQIFVLDVSGGDKVPAHGRPGRQPVRPARHQQDRPGGPGRSRSVGDGPGRGPGPGAGPVPGGGLSGSVRASRLTARAAVASRADAAGRSRVTVLRSDGPLALRETPLGVYLVGTAAGPLGGDDLALDIDVGPGACLMIRSAAGMRVQRSTASREHSPLTAERPAAGPPGRVPANGPWSDFSSRDGPFMLRVRATGLPRGDDHVPPGSTASRPGRHRFRRPVGGTGYRAGAGRILRGIRGLQPGPLGRETDRGRQPGHRQERHFPGAGPARA